MRSTLPIAGAALAAVAERCANEQARGTATAVFGIDQGAAEGQRLTYRFHFEWREPGAAEASVLWTDQVTLQAGDGRWRIDDFVHGGDGPTVAHVSIAAAGSRRRRPTT
jgi:hypothetical protein